MKTVFFFVMLVLVLIIFLVIGHDLYLEEGLSGLLLDFTKFLLFILIFTAMFLVLI